MAIRSLTRDLLLRVIVVQACCWGRNTVKINVTGTNKHATLYVLRLACSDQASMYIYDYVAGYDATYMLSYTC